MSRGRIRKFYFDPWTFSLDPVTSSVVAAVERLLQVGEQVIDVLQADGDAHDARPLPPSYHLQ